MAVIRDLVVLLLLLVLVAFTVDNLLWLRRSPALAYSEVEGGR